MGGKHSVGVGKSWDLFHDTWNSGEINLTARLDVGGGIEGWGGASGDFGYDFGSGLITGGGDPAALSDILVRFISSMTRAAR